ncbi:single-stranded-DNA-specific exonuclease RecJ [Lutibaculum baratangense]|uniref:Single-stranded-DNA-specific exonuclease RecJ n=1 Tax=Lutibaculum baratangense AMV1 TaxID=631454 RepID=V4QU65_9HYPH|nr:single-stranded-DNA-specific exonuclease RecJ [Lutibaculum baratangense]ESR23312.1 Single-stranded-DNA-specific exonuclease RecJ [Lutibaculum baratangense AMV1]
MVDLLTAGSGARDDSRRAVLGVERSATGRRWVDRLDPARHQAALAIAQRHDVPDLLARVLAARDVGLEGVEAYLDPSLKALLPDPSTLAGMDQAAARIAAAVRQGERIAIFGDYDVDGATSAALLARFLRANGLDPRIHIPDRIIEGYGPNVAAIEALAAAGVRLLVTVDCGATSFEPLQRARELGMDVVVADHHQMGEALPPAVAVVNPNRQDDLSGQGHLAAVGVVFLLVVAVNRALRQAGWYHGRREPELLSWLDLVALGTVADVVPLVGLNRAFVRKGLIALRRRQFVGLTALCESARITSPIDCYHLGFLLGPRINAGGRIGDSGLGVSLLLCEDPDEAATISSTLEELNRDRQEIERRILDEALAMLGEPPGEGGPNVVIAHADEDWHPGVLGLVATRVKDRFRRPAFAVAFDGSGQGTGSGRSVPGVDLGAIVRAAVAEGLLVKGGGHGMAAGVTLRRDRLEEFRSFADARAAEGLAAGASGDLEVDAPITAAAASVEAIRRLEAAGPYGQGSPDPVVALPAHRLSFAEATEHGHVRCQLTSPDGTRLKAIAFRAMEGDLGPALMAARGDDLHAAGTLRIDSWGGRETPSLQLRDVARPGRGA